MRRSLTVLLVAIALTAVPARGLAVQPGVRTDGSELASGRSGLDGALVTFEGEVISERLAGGPDHVWVNVLSGGTAIGVWMPREMAADIEVFGDWGHTGDRVSVLGTLNEGCDLHGGDLDVHAQAFDLLARGTQRQRSVSWWKLGVGVGGGAVAYLGWRRARRPGGGDRR